jgi:hypothetical protein
MLGIVVAALREIEFLECPPPRLDPFRLRSALSPIDEGLRSHLIQEFPIALRFTPRIEHRIRSQIIDRRPIVLSLGEVPGRKILPRDPRLPTLKPVLVPYTGNLRLRRNRPNQQASRNHPKHGKYLIA